MSYPETNTRPAEGWERLKAKTKSAPLLCNPIVDQESHGSWRSLRDDIPLLGAVLFSSFFVLLGILPYLALTPFPMPLQGKIGPAFVSLVFVAIGLHIFVACLRRYRCPVQLILDPANRNLTVRMGDGTLPEVELILPPGRAKIALRHDARWKYGRQDEAYCVDLDVLGDGPGGPKECIRILRDRSYGKLLSLCLELLGEERSQLLRDETLALVRLRSGETVKLTTAPQGDPICRKIPRTPDPWLGILVFKKSAIQSLCLLSFIGVCSMSVGGAGGYLFAMEGHYAGAAIFVLLASPWVAISVAGTIEVISSFSGIVLDLGRQEMRIDRRVWRKMCREIIAFPKVDCIQMTAVAANDDERSYWFTYEVNVVDRCAGLRRHALLMHEDYGAVLDFARYLSEEMGAPPRQPCARRMLRQEGLGGQAEAVSPPHQPIRHAEPWLRPPTLIRWSSWNRPTAADPSRTIFRPSRGFPDAFRHDQERRFPRGPPKFAAGDRGRRGGLEQPVHRHLQ